MCYYADMFWNNSVWNVAKTRYIVCKQTVLMYISLWAVANIINNNPCYIYNNAFLRDSRRPEYPHLHCLYCKLLRLSDLIQVTLHCPVAWVRLVIHSLFDLLLWMGDMITNKNLITPWGVGEYARYFCHMGRMGIVNYKSNLAQR